MSSLFKPTIVSYWTPEGRKCSSADAILTDATGQRLNRRGKKGKPVPRLKPGFERRVDKAKDWYGQYRSVVTGRVCRVPLECDGKEQARAKLADLVRADKSGETDSQRRLKDHAGRSLLEHVADFKAYLQAKGNTAKHAGLTAMHVRAVIVGCGFEKIPDVDAGRVMEFLADKRKPQTLLVKKGETTKLETVLGLSVQTSNHYLRAAKGFTRWLVRDRRASEDALQHLSRMNVQADRRRERRAISPEEFGLLVQATAEGEPWRKLTPAARAMLYTVAASTGFRASELASLTTANFALDRTPPTVTVKAGYSKHRRQDTQPLLSGIVAGLREFLATIEDGAKVWPGTWPEKAAEQLERDLDAARKNWIAGAQTPQEAAKRQDSSFLAFEDAEGRVFDFHALRGQFITSLGRAGVPLVTAQKLARHSDPKLTANVYTHLAMIDLGAAVESIELPILAPRLASDRCGLSRSDAVRRGQPVAVSA